MSVQIDLNVPCQVRDGVTLRANVYRPAAEGRCPVLLTRLPYGKDTHPWWNMLNPVRAAAAGYVVIAQDCRGRFASEGEFKGVPQEGPDGYDTVEWAASLPYSDGNVGMFGASYYGNTQWSAAMLRPPHLKAIAPAITWADYTDGGSFRGGAFELGKGLHWNLLMAIELVKRKLTAAGRPPAEVAETVRRVVSAIDLLSTNGYSELPLAALESLRPVGLAELLAPTLTPGPGAGANDTLHNVQHGEVDVPSLNIGGWYDIFIQGTLDNYVGMRANGRGAGRQAHLLIGPWAHLNTTSAVGELEFGMAASSLAIDMAGDLTSVQLRWFDHWLKGADNGVDREPPVRVFAMGVNRWRSLPDWPAPSVAGQAWHLHAGGRLGPDGPRADGPQAEAPASEYAYDPLNPAPTLGGNLLMPGRFGAGVKDQRPLSERPDVLTFTGEPLTSPLTVIGRVSATLYASSSASDTDFVVRLVDVHPDGFMQNLCDGVVRTRYRHSVHEPAFIEPDEVCELKIDLWSVAHVFQPGHRVAVQLTSSSFPRWDRNLNTREQPGTGARAEVAHQTVHHDAARPSAIHLPVAADS